MEFEELAKEIQRSSIALLRRGRPWQLDQLSQGEMMVLRFLVHQKDQSLPGELSRTAGVSTARIAAIINSLEKKGQVVRRADETDHRRVRVCVTQTGRDRLLAGEAALEKVALRILRELGQEDAAALARILRRLVEITAHCPDSVGPASKPEKGDSPC